MTKSKYRPEYATAFRETHREEIKAYHTVWRAAHPSSLTQYARNIRAKRQPFLRELKAKPCADCGMQYPHYVMDFDHRLGEAKVFLLSNMAMYSEATILAEAKKCDIVCSNCHRERTWQRKHNALQG